jgi:hypothetical protein
MVERLTKKPDADGTAPGFFKSRLFQVQAFSSQTDQLTLMFQNTGAGALRMPSMFLRAEIG